MTRRLTRPFSHRIFAVPRGTRSLPVLHKNRRGGVSPRGDTRECLGGGSREGEAMRNREIVGERETNMRIGRGVDMGNRRMKTIEA